jgi:pimeloyl-ACP methyl ester carboxylesterase
MKGNFIDTIRFAWKPLPKTEDDFFFLDTDYGKIRALDTKENKPVVINVPDGPNSIEHQLPLIRELSKNFRVVCFEYPGIGFSYPNSKFDYSYKHGAELLIQVMDLLDIPNAVLLFSCSNGFYAIKAVSSYPDRFKHIFLSQTPSFISIIAWTEINIPTPLKIPIVGQIVNSVSSKKLAQIWYGKALPKDSIQKQDFIKTSHKCLDHQGCFCLSSLVQGLLAEKNTTLNLTDVSATLVWGAKDYSHRNTDKNTIKDHIKNCEIIEFGNCGHFPELEDAKSFVQLIKERTQ